MAAGKEGYPPPIFAQVFIPGWLNASTLRVGFTAEKRIVDRTDVAHGLKHPSSERLPVLTMSPVRRDAESGFHFIRTKDAGEFNWPRELNFLARSDKAVRMPPTRSI